MVVPLQSATPAWSAVVEVSPVVDEPRRTRFPPRVEITLLTLAVLAKTHGPSARPVEVAPVVPDPMALPPGSPASVASAAPPPMTMSPPPDKVQVPATLFQPVHMVLVD